LTVAKAEMIMLYTSVIYLT